MTGGVSDFYRRIGYRDTVVTVHYVKNKTEKRAGRAPEGVHRLRLYYAFTRGR